MAAMFLKRFTRIQYNSPVVLTFSLLAVVVHLMNLVVPHFADQWCAMDVGMSFRNPGD